MRCERLANIRRSFNIQNEAYTTKVGRCGLVTLCVNMKQLPILLNERRAVEKQLDNTNFAVKSSLECRCLLIKLLIRQVFQCNN